MVRLCVGSDGAVYRAVAAGSGAGHHDRRSDHAPTGRHLVNRPSGGVVVRGRCQIWRRRRSIQPMAQPLRHWSSAGGTEGRWWRFRCGVSTERSRGRGTGAHVHAGPCVAGDGAAAGPHYNSTGGAVVGPSTEVWLDFTVRPDGTALAVALVPFVVPPGARSIVIHAMARMPNGMAGARLACLPLQL